MRGETPAPLSPTLLSDLSAMTTRELETMARRDPNWYRDVMTVCVLAAEEDRKVMALDYYRLVNPMAAPIHTSLAREIAVVGGNRSSKTESVLAELAMQVTGHVPRALRETHPLEKKTRFRPPIRALVMCNSLTDTLDPVIKPKLRWDTWSGPGTPQDGRGHWGWIPRDALVGGTWEKACSEKHRTLRVRALADASAVSTIHFGSYDQEVSAMQGKSFHLIVNDELPPEAVYREERLRVMDVRGRILTAFTPPDEPGVDRGDVAWFYDQVYERGLPGPQHDADFETIVLWTEKNELLAPAEIQRIAHGLTESQRQARLYGQFLHLSGVVYPLFAATPAGWCFRCGKRLLPGTVPCPACGGDFVGDYTHVVEPFEIPKTWPVVFVIDPHPRKADACGWFAITPADDVYLVGECSAQGDAQEVARQVFAWEEAQRIHPVRRLMDPNMATETNDRLERGWTLRMAYDRVGLRCDLANDSVPVGIQNVTALLIPDRVTRKPRFQAFATCRQFLFGMTHWSYDEWHRTQDREPKETVRDRWKDFPDLLRYLANDAPSFTQYTRGARWSSPAGPRPRRGY